MKRDRTTAVRTVGVLTLAATFAFSACGYDDGNDSDMMILAMAAGGAAHTGALTYGGRYSDRSTIYDDSCVTISPDGAHAYVTGYYAHAVAWFTRNPATGALTYGGRYSDSSTINDDSCVTISPDGAHAYVTGYSASSVAWFTRNPVTGALTYGGRYSDSSTIYGASCVTISPDGAHAYVTGYDAHAVAWFT
ncbi:MAG: beta-propeller fold lactonase family protein, partial [Spirochaetes bacterium]|nr:beta-propeller fold lactonase family protein [Spirochaetota bacterium]